MGKQFSSVLHELLNGGAKTPVAAPERLLSLRPHLAASREKAHQAMRDGLKVFMTKSTVEAFEGLLKTRPSSHLMRRLLEEIGNGTLCIVVPAAPAPAPRLTGTIHPKPTTVPVVLSVDQLSGGRPFSLKQAAKILNTSPNQLYARCVKGRIHFEKERSRYYIPASEVTRLQVIGL